MAAGQVRQRIFVQHGEIGIEGTRQGAPQAAGAGDWTTVLELQSQWQRFLALGWRGDIIAAFEALMRLCGYADSCFRVPPPAPGVDPELLRELASRLAAIEALGGA